MSTILDKSLIINKIKAYYNFNKDAEFARFLGIKPQTLASWHKRNTFDIELLYAKCGEINPEYFFTGKDELFKKETPNSGVQLHNTNRKTTDKIIDNQEIPLFNFQATAGLKELFDSSSPREVLDTIRIPNAPACDGAINVTGDSMYPLLKSGDIILYKQIPVEYSNIYFGEMYLIGINHEYDEYITVKYIQKSTIGTDWVKLVSQNKHHEPRDVPISSITALAMVKLSIRFNTMF